MTITPELYNAIREHGVSIGKRMSSLALLAEANTQLEIAQKKAKKATENWQKAEAEAVATAAKLTELKWWDGVADISKVNNSVN